MTLAMSIKEVLFSFFIPIIYPFRIHDYYRFNIPLPDDQWAYPKKLNIVEAVGVAWAFQILKAIIKIMLLNLTVYGLSTYQDSSYSYFRELALGSALSEHFLTVLGICFGAVIFPITRFFVIEFWSVFLRFMAGMLDYKGDKHSMVEHIMVSAQSSYIFVLVPILGDFVQKIAGFVLMYGGIKKQLGTSTFLTILILLAPLALFIGIASVLGVFLTLLLI